MMDAFPLCVDSQDVDTIVDTIARISKEFRRHQSGRYRRPRCFEVEEKLKARVDIPVFTMISTARPS